MKAVQTQIVKIGSAKGIKIPKALLEEAGLSGTVQIEAVDNQLIIRKRKPREGWEAEAKLMAANEEEDLTKGWYPTKFDLEEWVW